MFKLHPVKKKNLFFIKTLQNTKSQRITRTTIHINDTLRNSLDKWYEHYTYIISFKLCYSSIKLQCWAWHRFNLQWWTIHWYTWSLRLNPGGKSGRSFSSLVIAEWRWYNIIIELCFALRSWSNWKLMRCKYAKSAILVSKILDRLTVGIWDP